MPDGPPDHPDPDYQEAREADREPPELGAAFQTSEAAAQAWGHPTPPDQDTATAEARRRATANPAMPDWAPGPHQVPPSHTIGGPGWPEPPNQFDPQASRPATRTLTTIATGDPGIDAMLACRAVFESLPDYERRRLLNFLADRYAGT